MKSRLLFISIALLSLMVMACTKGYFDDEGYKDLVAKQFPVEGVDATHKWSVIGETTADIKLNIESGKTYTVKIYDDDPIANFYTGTVLIEGEVDNGSSLTANFSHPQDMSKFYVAIVDNDNLTKTYIMPVEARGGFLKVTIGSRELSAMATTTKKIYDFGFNVTYCFEDSYPVPSDYDFNDVVIAAEIIKNIGVSKTTIDIDLKLKAVGSYKQMAAALHIAGLKAANIESVECTGDLFKYYEFGLGNYYNADNQLAFPVRQPEEGFLVSAAQVNDVYIPITNDVHFAINRGRLTPTGALDRINYNSMLESQKADTEIKMSGADVSAVGGHIRLTLKDGVGDMGLTVRNLDLFIMEDDNGVVWEVHTYEYKSSPVIFLQGIYTKNMYTWALAVPGNDFRWPAEGYAIGSSSKSEAVGGAYQTVGHSFAEWAKNKKTALDWYRYPMSDMVW